MSEQGASPRASSPAPSVPLHWRLRVCRWLWHVLHFVWVTLIVGIVIATIANLNTTKTDTPPAQLYLVHLAQTYPLPVWTSLGILSALTLLSWLGSREKPVLPTRPFSEQDRSHMLRRLRMQYKQILAQSLQGAVLELGLASRPAAVQNTVSLALHVPHQPEQQLPARTSIVQAYELAQQELLILGEPGAGKSTLLAELAHFLVEQAEQDRSRPLPILLPLSSWTERQRPLDEWLSEEIAHLYNVPRRLSQHWVQAEQVLPLLDGLDEMKESARPACIAAINTYHREHLRPIVVCSRTSEYDAATRHEQLALHTAVVVQPLEARQVKAYLANLGKPLAGLRAALKTNAILQELATTPLLLQVLMLTYHGTSARLLSRQEVQLREQIWTDYIRRVVRDKGDAKSYPLPVTVGWLGWLASEMRVHNLAIFSIESLQPYWLPTRRKSLYRWSVGLVAGLVDGLLSGSIIGLVAGLLIGLVAGLGFSVRYGLLGGLVGCLVSGPIGGFSGELLTERLILSPNKGIHYSLKYGLLLFAYWLVSGLVIGLFGELAFNSRFGLVGGLWGGLIAGTGFGLDSVLQHYLLHFWLAQSGVFPWRAIPFLEDATSRILLRRVGGGYSFAHRLLLDFFADLGTQTLLAQEAAQTKSTPVQTKASTSADESLK